jgi:N-methylhydantoinase A
MVTEGKAAYEVVASAGVQVDRIDIVYELDMHYVGQTHAISVPLPVTWGEATTGIDAELIGQAFEAAYQAQFSRKLPGIAVKIVTLRTAAIGRRPHFDLAALAPSPDASIEKAGLGERNAWFDGAWHRTSIWSRLELPINAVISGPAILEQPDATTVVEPGLLARVDTMGNILIERQPT